MSPEDNSTPQPVSDKVTEAVSTEKRAHPIFYTENGRRWFWFSRVGGIGLLIASGGVLLLIASVFALPFLPRSPLPRVVDAKDLITNPEVALGERDHRQLGVKQLQDRKRLQQLDNERTKEEDARNKLASDFLTEYGAKFFPSDNLTDGATAPLNASPIVAGFYVNWEETSPASTRRNIASLTHFIPEWLHLHSHGHDYKNPKSTLFTDGRQGFDRTEMTPLARQNKVPILPILNNFTRKGKGEEGVGDWDPRAIHEIVTDAKLRRRFVETLRDWLKKEQLQGINIDFEQVSPEDSVNLIVFMEDLYRTFHPAGLLVTMDMEVESDALDYEQLAKWCDWVVPMFYDEHTGESEAGAVGSIRWTKERLEALLSKIPASKLVMGVGNHGYDWTKGKPGAQNLTYQSAILQAKDSQPDAIIKLDPSTLNPTFSYTEETPEHGEERHTVWFQDAVSVYNQLIIGKGKKVRGSALWFMGSEDPTLWKFNSRQNWNTDWGKLTDAGALNQITYGNETAIDFEGEGELLQPRSGPQEGFRTVKRDPQNGLIAFAEYNRDPNTNQFQFPSAYVVRRFGGGLGNVKKQIVLTFDDGPDPEWTPKILDILKHYGVPAVFFVVGQKAENYPDLVGRMWNEGHEIGNHSLTHPNLFLLSPLEQRLQLTTTQRIIQAVTGHSTTLFRPPYGGDPEPTTAQEVAPMVTAKDLNYITVGEKNDPQDWRLNPFKRGSEILDMTKFRTGEEIAQSVIVNRDEGSIVLLHDAGGDRSRTLIALPLIIEKLRAQGYSFIGVAGLRGVAREVLMPRVSGKDVLLVGADRYVFETSYAIQRFLSTMFVLSLVLGFSRVGIFVLLALIQKTKERYRVFPVGFTPSVSVVIAAYNEEKVIAKTIFSLLESDYPNLQIIVVDDGSKDNTAKVVRETFSQNANVTLISKPNGGKASALNRGITAATGDIMVSLDADTLFAKETIWRLVRHFGDANVGAVSGNVRVGNTHNIWTRWQALEYITSQNFDRRGYDLLNCITVVPGAVGALRRDAVVAVGGYTHDTLAEDTDLTWKMRRAGWRIVNDNTAMAYTEAPEDLRNLAKQRFRWAFGTLQCLWKHRTALFRYRAFGCIALPSLWLYQILFPAVSPFMDLAVLYSIFSGNFAQLFGFYAAFLAFEMLAAALAVYMDKANWKLLPWLILQRFVYRQLMYYVILKSLYAAVRGSAVGWGKLERTGTAQIDTKT